MKKPIINEIINLVQLFTFIDFTLLALVQKFIVKSLYQIWMKTLCSVIIYVKITNLTSCRTVLHYSHRSLPMRQNYLKG